jgi:FkbM family methyltransferase
LTIPLLSSLVQTARRYRRRLRSASGTDATLATPPPLAREDAQARAVFEGLKTFEGPPPEGWIVDFLGIRTQWKFVDGHWPHTAAVVSSMWQQTPAPKVNGLEYFEWLDLLHAVQDARDRFVMVELGAGYGRWAVRAARLLERVNPMPFTLMAAEAEPTHFEWLKEHLRDNGIDPEQHHLVCAPVAASDAPVHFLVGEPSKCYGQAIVAQPDATAEGTQAKTMAGIPLVSLLERYPIVDLIDLDIQGAELDVLSAAVDVLDARVKRLQVGTHSRAIEDGLRSLFTAHGWQLQHDFAMGAKYRAEGLEQELDGGDGVQTWINPRLGAR